MPTVNKLRIRQRLGKYRIEKRLGEGGFAAVFQAMDTIMGARVALKIPHSTLVDAELLKAFRHEARLVAKVDHPGILQIKDASVIDGRLVISFPLGKETLADRLSRRMSLETIFSISGQLLAAVAFAHQRKVIHCDIKPENIIMFDGSVLKLADFGIAKVARRTVHGCGTGTVGHMAPEQAMGRPSVRSDVFAVGLVIHRMFSGQWAEWPYQWPLNGHRRLRERIPPTMITWLRKALELNAAQRFRDCAQMQNAFTRLRPGALRFIQQQRRRPRGPRPDTEKPAGRTQRAA
ncbi:MAG: serine/threonine protein kinase [Fuerstiella sp.]|nr:serine/threonine protein kinase [Fuerstiella sp.]